MSCVYVTTDLFCLCKVYCLPKNLHSPNKRNKKLFEGLKTVYQLNVVTVDTIVESVICFGFTMTETKALSLSSDVLTVQLLSSFEPNRVAAAVLQQYKRESEDSCVHFMSVSV